MVDKGDPDDQLEISDDGLPTLRKLENAEAPAADQAAEDSPKSFGAESSYSDFMQQWKNKLIKDEEQDEAANGPSDAVSNYSARQSNHSRRSNNPADNSPFRDISSKQTHKLLRAQKTEIIPEQQYEESDGSSEGDDTVILSKVERRRLNLLNERQASTPLPNPGQIGPLTQPSSEPAQQQAAAQEAAADEEFELL